MTTQSAPSACAELTREEREALVAGLEKVKAAGPRMMIDAARGEKANIELKLTRRQWALLSLLKHSAQLTLGRPCSNAIVIRRALEVYSGHLGATLGSPEAAAEEAKALQECRK